MTPLNKFERNIVEKIADIVEIRGYKEDKESMGKDVHLKLAMMFLGDALYHMGKYTGQKPSLIAEQKLVKELENYGSWDVNDGRDYAKEMMDECVDSYNYGLALMEVLKNEK